MDISSKVNSANKMSVTMNILLYSLILSRYPLMSSPNFVLILTDDQDLMLNGLVRYDYYNLNADFFQIIFSLDADGENTKIVSKWGQNLLPHCK